MYSTLLFAKNVISLTKISTFSYLLFELEYNNTILALPFEQIQAGARVKQD